MDQIQPAQTAQFLRRFVFRGGSLRRIRLHSHSAQRSSGELIVSIRRADSNERVRLRIVLEGVEEYRFQRRPGPALFRLKEVRLGYFNGLFFLNLDAYPEEGPPALIDFRASDAFLAGRSFTWEILPAKSKPSPTL